MVDSMCIHKSLNINIGTNFCTSGFFITVPILILEQ